MGFRGKRYILPLVIVALLGVTLVGAQIKIQKVQIKPKLIRANPVLLRQMYYVRKNVPYIKILKRKEIPLIPLSMMRIEAPMRIKRVHKIRRDEVPGGKQKEISLTQGELPESKPQAGYGVHSGTDGSSS